MLLASRLVMVTCGYATYVVVAKALTTAEFGLYGVLASIINVLNTVLGTGTNQGISRLVSRHPDAAPMIVRLGLRWAGVASVGLCLGLWLAAPPIAVLLRDPSLTPLLRIASFVPGLYAFNATYAGYLNGARALARQGFAIMTLAVARAVLIGAAAMLGYGVEGTLYGAALAAVVGAAGARALAGSPAGVGSVGLGVAAFSRMMISFLGVSLLLQLMLATDVLLVKGLTGDESSVEAGLYTAAQSIARIPYYLLLGVSQMVYPRLSARCAGEGAALAARRTCSLVLSVMCIVLSGLLAVTLPLTDEMIRIVYPARYAGGAGALGWLLAASAALSLAEAALTMLSGAGGPRRPAAVLALALTSQLALGALLVPRAGAAGAAMATLAAASLATILAAMLLRKLLGAGLRGRLLATSILPICCLGAAALEWSRHAWPRSATAAFMLAAYGSYLAVLWRLNAKDLRVELAGATPPHGM